MNLSKAQRVVLAVASLVFVAVTLYTPLESLSTPYGWLFVRYTYISYPMKGAYDKTPTTRVIDIDHERLGMEYGAVLVCAVVAFVLTATPKSPS